MKTSFDRNEFYSRQRVLSELGTEGQEKLKDSEVAVVGIGGLGSVSALYLSLAGLGKITLVDQDTVEMNNLHRQVLFSLDDIRYPKVEAAARRISMINPEVKVNAVPENLEAENVSGILDGADCVVDGLDNMQTRYIINRYCVERKIPFVFGGAIGMEGNVAVFKSPETPCLQCVLPGLNDADLPTCDTAESWVQRRDRRRHSSLRGYQGPCRHRTEIQRQTANLRFAQSEYRTVNLSIRPDCEICGVTPTSAPTFARRLAWLCGSDTANVNPETPLSLDLEKLTKTISQKHKVLLTTPMVIVFDFNGHEVSLFRKGRMLIKNVRDEKEALTVSNEMARLIGVT